jgi:hypothetical protein
VAAVGAVLLALGVPSVAAAVRRRPQGFLPLDVVRNAVVVRSALASSAVPAAWFALLIAVPVVLVRLGWSPLQVGLALVPSAATGTARAEDRRAAAGPPRAARSLAVSGSWRRSRWPWRPAARRSARRWPRSGAGPRRGADDLRLRARSAGADGAVGDAVRPEVAAWRWAWRCWSSSSAAASARPWWAAWPRSRIRASLLLLTLLPLAGAVIVLPRRRG